NARTLPTAAGSDEALCRTRTGDPFLTMEALMNRDPACHAEFARATASQRAHDEHPRVPDGARVFPPRSRFASRTRAREPKRRLGVGLQVVAVAVEVQVAQLGLRLAEEVA